MISYGAYKVIHLFGIFMIISSLGGVALHVMNGGTRKSPFRMQIALIHGFGMLLALIGGFGLLARLGIHWPWPMWVALKITIWVSFGLALAVAYRVSARWVWWAVPVLGACAAYLAIQKPF